MRSNTVNTSVLTIPKRLTITDSASSTYRMFSTELRPEIWLSMNCWRVCTFAFGKPVSACSIAAWFASFSPPVTVTNV